MHKNFDAWNENKKKLECFGHEYLSFHEREIWWCSLGLNLGDEQDGKNELFERPVLVLKKFNSRVAIVVPLTSRVKFGRHYFPLHFSGKRSTVIFSQLKLVSVKRFRRFIRKINLDHFTQIQLKVSELLFE